MSQTPKQNKVEQNTLKTKKRKIFKPKVKEQIV